MVPTPRRHFRPNATVRLTAHTSGASRRISRSTSTGRKYGGMLPDEMQRQKQLEDGATRQKKIIVGLMLDQTILGHHLPKALTPARKRKLVDWMPVDWDAPIHRARKALRFGAPPTMTSPAIPGRPVTHDGSRRSTKHGSAEPPPDLFRGLSASPSSAEAKGLPDESQAARRPQD